MLPVRSTAKQKLFASRQRQRLKNISQKTPPPAPRQNQNKRPELRAVDRRKQGYQLSARTKARPLFPKRSGIWRPRGLRSSAQEPCFIFLSHSCCSCSSKLCGHFSASEDTADYRSYSLALPYQQYLTAVRYC